MESSVAGAVGSVRSEDDGFFGGEREPSLNATPFKDVLLLGISDILLVDMNLFAVCLSKRFRAK
jgi:hypothetical protein